MHAVSDRQACHRGCTSQCAASIAAAAKNTYLEGQGDFVSSLKRGITGVITCAIGDINLLTKSPRRELLGNLGINPYRIPRTLRSTGSPGSCKMPSSRLVGFCAVTYTIYVDGVNAAGASSCMNGENIPNAL